MQDGARGQAAVQLLAVEPAHVGRGEGLKLDPSNGRDQMHPDDALVPLVSPLAHRVPDAIRKPAGKVLPDGLLSSVVGEAAFSVG